MRNLFAVAVGCIGSAVSAETLRFEGVLGNSGELEKPVTFGSMARETRGLGAAYDAARGVLYDRAGSGRLNAYALDGRLLAQYKLPDSQDHRDMMTLCGDHLVMLLGGQLHKLRLNAPDGAAAGKVAAAITEPDGLSSSARGGRIAVRNKAGKLVLLNPADDTVTAFGEAAVDGFTGMDWDEKGDFYLVASKVAYK